ncbi:Isoaspartyl aminopeptidase Asp-X dipeptidase [Arcticibacter svalbardensis MN12-7]|uniref:Isoaspartyl peptidase n=1 Tax=Arcticibacter svalbardensis MN12-7 TaxID=1150600 RepID=R9GQQ4_9SPHI|nr:isoaspartyl peptidase/L-asparaginase [Arcticibacter svalbardensis]EOR94056.1 Isoaspartyl aminopeptidase Asp-X dipeptidase [Arcticibacter svalbardensis MN12-7]
MVPKIIIHGGFFSESLTNNEVKQSKQKALKKIAEQSHTYLLSHTALETVVYAVALLEDCELFNAGLGSQIQSDGKIRMSAALMDGHSQRFSGVINIEDIQNPIHVANLLIDFDDRVLGGPEALSFARKNGFRFYDPETVERRLDYEFKLKQTIRTGTVGCVALDAQGHLAAGTSTGGKGFEVPGRISDSATVAGNYANAFAGISCTGVGEDIVSAALAAKIVTRVTDGFSLQEATDKTMAELKPYDGFAGIIGITSQGEIYHADTHPYMVWASYSSLIETFL